MVELSCEAGDRELKAGGASGMEAENVGIKQSRLLEAGGLWFGGAEEDRTPDLNTASVALSQLSYSPNGLPAVCDRWWR